MKPSSRDKRRDEIMDVAVEILAQRGYRDASMLDVARRASASKETLYAWFGDKRGLFEAVIRRNARRVQKTLATQLEQRSRIERGLVEFGCSLLELLLGDGAVAINRAAISEARSDPSLAKILSAVGREATVPDFIRFLAFHRERGSLVLEEPAEAAEDFLGLLLGDVQVRRLLGALPAPGKSKIEARAARATQKFMKLYGA